MSVSLFQEDSVNRGTELRSMLVIRDALNSDVEGIRTIESKPEYRACIGNWSEAEYRGAIADSSQQVSVAVVETLVVGFFVLRDLRDKDCSVNLMRIAVSEPGRGVGSALLQHALGQAFEVHGAHRLWLDVFTTNERAQQIYRDFGFVAEGVLRESKLRDGQYHSQRIMSMLESEYRNRKGL